MHVTVIGGGLAGMTAAYRLLQQGCKVTLFESSHRLGGKAGADPYESDFDEHGYHIFPVWYLNIWNLVDELGIRDNFKDCRKFHQLRVGDYPTYRTLENFVSVRYSIKNLFSKVSSLWQMILFFYSAFDLSTQPYRSRAFLDQLSTNGFLRSRFYRTEEVAHLFHSSIVGGSSAPSYQASAMTFRNVLRFWMMYPDPMSRILKGDLQQFFIDPFEQKLLELGCEIHKNHRLVKIQIEEKQITELQFLNTEEYARTNVSVETVVLAIPMDRLRALLNDDLLLAEPDLSGLHFLNSRPMAAFNLYMNRKIPDIPPDHVNLLGSKYGISFIDVSQTWEGYENTTVLNAIASSYAYLESHSENAALHELVTELMEFIPEIDWNDIKRMDLQSHIDEQLVMNDVGAWRFRPSSTTKLPNLYLAGAYCKNHVDLVTMESAVVSGLHAAEAIRQEHSLRGKEITIDVPKGPPLFLLILGRLIMLPVAFIAKLISIIIDSPQDK